MKRFALILILVVLLGAGAAGLYYYKAAGSAAPEETATTEPAEDDASAQEEDGDAPIPVRVVDASLGSVSTYVTAAANLVPENQVKVLAEAEGRVTRLEVEEGDFVRKGQLLAALLRDEAEIAHNKAKLKAANARMAFERAERMAGEQLIAQEQYDKTTMDHRIAQQELAEARWKLDKTEIKAPFDGRVTLRSVTLGQHIRPGDELFVVTDFDPLIARIYLPEKDVITLTEGRDVKITLKADQRVGFGGRIRQISPIVDTGTGTVKVTVAAIEPPAAVRPGGFVRIDIVRETRDDTLLLPRKAVVRELNSAHVFVVSDDVAHKRAVKVGLEESDRLEILSGIEAGETIVVAGQGGLKDGSKIKVLG